MRSWICLSWPRCVEPTPLYQNLYQPATDLPSVLFCGSYYTCARHSSRLARLEIQYDASQLPLPEAGRAPHVLLHFILSKRMYFDPVTTEINTRTTGEAGCRHAPCSALAFPLLWLSRVSPLASRSWHLPSRGSPADERGPLPAPADVLPANRWRGTRGKNRTNCRFQHVGRDAAQ